ncbi:MAG: biopolymer transporter ExbD [Opitutae bacterium]|jgi:biopolymer transport protein ExbD|nr:biopolymer transporter ExbD [Opitutae bacterium]MBT4225108.1 biopolymer transporter ExbD [Opitutae bacterium]MBT5380533.1 biopolymer transporter ExbD [Opitutae bacterium]MBT5691892.1 biopolymer transporter ExbD [Opitutae bacterium]MBT6463996.1 biopolymer transporter ExbD [Opitutae bacterium]
MRIPREESSDDNVINISSLLDVMFILIIFFLATATFTEEERDIKVNLPQSAAAKSATQAPKMIIINVRQDGSYNIANESMDISGLQTTLQEAVSKNPDQKVLVRGDKNALHGHVASAVDMCKKSGITHTNIGYESRVE